MRGLCYLILPILSRVFGGSVVGIIGHNVSLPCSYDALAYGSLRFCWGKGKVPVFKCSNTIVSWDDGVTENQKGPRFQLRGDVDFGDASLTIVNVDWSDAGVYGCRVQVPGMFNDLKVNIRLLVEPAPDRPAESDPCTATQAMASTSQFEGTQEAQVLRIITVKEFDLFSFLGVGNIGRLAAVFLVTIILILAFIFWRRLLPTKTTENIETSAQENIYESIPMH
ncbi:unnamed protein product [Knipowitschia caucasica]|uniref:Ig-like domain-containing protein n=1 Tax=Knipowitschia caucasica TaxID=637954 RepID=A0AAV2MIV9_KNICA